MWDVFVSHASEDKEVFVRPLVEFLTKLGLKAWYDEFALSVGDSLSRSIDTGLAQSRYGIVVLSPDFFRKDWPEYELRGLVAKELGRDKVILPLWWNVTREDILKYSPPLADKIGIDASRIPLSIVAGKLLAVVSPELHKRVTENSLMAAVMGECDPLASPTLSDSIASAGKLAEQEPKVFPASMIRRIRLVRAALLDLLPLSLDEWLRPLSPYADTEVSKWETVTASLLEYCHVHTVTTSQKRILLSLLCGLSLGTGEQELRSQVDNLPDELLLELKGLLNVVDADPKEILETAADRSQREVQKRYIADLREKFKKAFSH